jgi:hypothetical protein
VDGQVFVLTVEASGEVTPAGESPEAEESPEREEMADG